jgi:hypothetical protein
MANVTIALEEDVLARLRWDAQTARKSVSRYIADLIAADQARLRAQGVAIIEDFLAGPDLNLLRDDGTPIPRDELYDRPCPGGHQRDPLRPRWPVSGQAGPLRGLAEGAERYESAGDKPSGRRRAPTQRPRKTED